MEPIRKFITFQYQKFGRFFQTLAKQKLNDEAEANDLVQEVFLNLLHAEDRLRVDEKDLFRYIYRCVLNGIYQRWDHKKKLELLTHRLKTEQHSDSIAQGDKMLRQATAQIDLQKLEDALSPAQHELLIWLYFEDLSTRDIGDLLGISDRAVRKRRNTLLELLRKELSS